MKRIVILALLALAVPVAAQETPKFGGCFGPNNTTCVGPSVSANVVAISFKDGSASVGPNLGLGYGITFRTDKWYRYGAALNVALRGTQDGQKPLISALGSFAEYLRVGVAYQIGGGDRSFKDAGMLLLGIGADFGLGTVAKPQ